MTSQPRSIAPDSARSSKSIRRWQPAKRVARWTSVAFAVSVASTLASAQSTARESIATGGAQGDSYSFDVGVSADGRFVVFESESTNLVAGDTNNRADVFVRDRQTGTTARVSVATGGAEGNGNSGNPSISANGRFVVFRGLANNLVAGDTNGASDVFLHDRQNGTTERISVSTAGVEGNANCYYPTVSADGRMVAFQSLASNLVASDANGVMDVFVRDRQLGTTERASVDSTGAEANNPAESPVISADGHCVVFHCYATNFAGGATNGFPNVYLRDLASSATELVTLAFGGGPAYGGGVYPAVSADGRHVAFQSSSNDVVANDTNFSTDVFVRDRLNGTTERVSVSTGGAQATSESYDASISGDGRIVSFSSTAANLVAGDTNAALDILVRDRQAGTTVLASVTTGGTQSDAGSWYSSMSLDGRFVAFESYGTNLDAGDTNGVIDAFLHDRGAPPPFGFCFGDGTGTACPCGPGAPGKGCPNSVDATGANLAASGTASTTTDTLVLSGTGMPNSSALYFQGTAQVAGGAGAVFGDGLRCAGGTIVRLGTKSNVAGGSQYPAGSDLPVSVKGLVTLPGVRTYQVWYRNAAVFCSASTFNLANGISVSWIL